MVEELNRLCREKKDRQFGKKDRPFDEKDPLQGKRKCRPMANTVKVPAEGVLLVDKQDHLNRNGNHLRSEGVILETKARPIVALAVPAALHGREVTVVADNQYSQWFLKKYKCRN